MVSGRDSETISNEDWGTAENVGEFPTRTRSSFIRKHECIPHVDGVLRVAFSIQKRHTSVRFGHSTFRGGRVAAANRTSNEADQPMTA